MQVERIELTITEFLRTEFPNDDLELGAETDLIDGWLGDSLSIVEIVLFLESEFGIGIDRADINGDVFANVASLGRFVAARMNA